MRILLDLDEVLCDWVGGACRAWGVELDQVVARWQPGVWDIVPPLGEALAVEGKYLEGFARHPFTPAVFWNHLSDLGATFWADLKPLPWAEEVVSLVSHLTDDWHVVTSPSRCPTSYDGKVRWLKGYFGLTFDRFAVTPHKYTFAGPGVILVDDSDANVEAFTRPRGGWPGGMGVVFPRHHNSRHEHKSDPVAVVHETLLRKFDLEGRTEPARTKGAKDPSAQWGGGPRPLLWYPSAHE